MTKKLRSAIQNIEDALMQGRELKITIILNPDVEEEVDYAVTENVPAQLGPQVVCSEMGLETFEDALISIGNNL